MADLDADLGHRLARLAESVPVAPWLGHVEPSPVATRQRVRMAWLTPLVVLVLVTAGSIVFNLSNGPRPEATAGASPGLGIHVVNLDRPTVDVMIDDEVLATVRCGETKVILPRKAEQGPWIVEIRSGEESSRVSVDGPLPRAILLRDGQALTGPWPMSFGPAPAPTCTPVGSTPGSAADIDQDGAFALELRADKQRYAPGEAIDVTASLLYRGPNESVSFRNDSSGPITFGIREKVFGAIDVGSISLLMWGHSELRRGEALVEGFRKGGGFDGDHPDEAMLMAWMQDPILRLPSGTYHLHANASGDQVSAGQPAFSLSAEIVIVVDEDPTATPDIPAPTEWADKPVYGGADIGSVVLQIRSVHARYEAGTPIELEASYWFADGPPLVASFFAPELSISIEQLDATSPQSHVVLHDGGCIDLGKVEGVERHVTLGPMNVTRLTADAVPDTIDELFVDGALRLPVGRWRISASVAGTFARCGDEGDPYALGTSVEIEVVERLD